MSSNDDDDDEAMEVKEQQHQQQPQHDALILFDASLMKRIQSTHRLPGTYIGVRKIRPSSKDVHRARRMAKQQKKAGGGSGGDVALQIEPLPHVSFKVVDPETGQERRMTNQEKKAVKLERAQLMRKRKEEAKAKQQQQQLQQLEQAQQQQQQHVDQQKQQHHCNQGGEQETEGKDQDDTLENESSLQSKVAQALKGGKAVRESGDGNKVDGQHSNSNNSKNNNFYYFKVNPATLQQELADLGGDRNEVPPVLLSASQAHVATTNHLINIPNEESKNDTVAKTPHHQQSPAPATSIRIDDAYAQEWAAALRASMVPAVETRKAEDMRGMVYDIVPQVWKRLRPSFSHDNKATNVGLHKESSLTGNDLVLPCTMRPPMPLDKDWEILMQVLYQGENVHIGCGAKFGCDVLLYDGPRNERHSFAGLRLLPSSSLSPAKNGRTSAYPLPRAYDLAGYVRCLNTAGKLALVATVLQDDRGVQKVAILDLALEKVDVKRKPKPMKTTEKRLETLAKT